MVPPDGKGVNFCSKVICIFLARREHYGKSYLAGAGGLATVPEHAAWPLAVAALALVGGRWSAQRSAAGR